MFRQLAKWLLTYDLETDRLRQFFARWSLEGVRIRVLDVGSGYGRNLKLLHDLGCDVVGVEVNRYCIESLRADGHACIRPEELGAGRGEFLRPDTCVSVRSEEHTSELQSRLHLVCRLLLEKKKHNYHQHLILRRKPSVSNVCAMAATITIPRIILLTIMMVSICMIRHTRRCKRVDI